LSEAEARRRLLENLSSELLRKGEPDSTREMRSSGVVDAMGETTIGGDNAFTKNKNESELRTETENEIIQKRNAII